MRNLTLWTPCKYICMYVRKQLWVLVIQYNLCISGTQSPLVELYFCFSNSLCPPCSCPQLQFIVLHYTIYVCTIHSVKLSSSRVVPLVLVLSFNNFSRMHKKWANFSINCYQKQFKYFIARQTGDSGRNRCENKCVNEKRTTNSSWNAAARPSNTL